MSPTRLFSELRAYRNRPAPTAVITGEFDHVTLTDQGMFRTMSDDPMFGVVGSGACVVSSPRRTTSTQRT